MKPGLFVLLAFMSWNGLPAAPGGASPAPATPATVRWKHGPPAGPDYFPIAVWLQHPRNAARFQAAGINLYVGLWQGPTASQLAELKQANMPVICAQNSTGLDHLDDPIIVGWMHDDEPDNAQSLGPGRGYGPPVTPEVIRRDYSRIRAADPSRPVLLNLGQGVAWDNYIGRGVRRNHPEDYPEYVKGGDIVSFDIYPAVHDSPEVAGRLEFVARGVERLRRWAGEGKWVWNCIECTHISNPPAKATPAQVRAEVWMSLIRGSRGLIYFVHEFKPVFREAALLEDPEMLAAVTAINRQIRELAPVLNQPTLDGDVTGGSSDPEVPLAWMLKRLRNEHYLFAVSLASRPARGSFRIEGLPAGASIEVLGEGRSLRPVDGGFEDAFGSYDVHLYRIRASN